MARLSRTHCQVFCLVAAATILVLAGCGKNKERTRQDDRAELGKMLAKFEKWTTQRKPSAFGKLVTETFDAETFLDSMWLGIDAEKVAFLPRRTRIAADEARMVFEATYVRHDSVVDKQYFALGFVFGEEGWKVRSFSRAESAFQ